MNTSKKHIILETKNLTIGYQQKKAKKIIASDVNLAIEKGKFIALLGKNGIGKSTLLRTISKVQNQLSGDVFLNDKNLHEYSNKELATNLSLVLTERLPESQLTVFELIALGRQPYTNWIDTLSEKDIEKINVAIQLTEVEHLKEHRFYELSDGQLQRVLIARALAQDTDVIILDEPTAHLDMHHTYKIFQLLKNLVATTQKTILISTHQINLAIEIVDELIIMNSDEVISGKTEDLIEQNKFKNLFPKEILHFNKNLRQFTISKDN
ncbi:Fe(3+) dicitrate transport ATP-binding protein FecE [Polaribacter huanghezhanensis]|uniref:ABC transporter ATP-binding protein n=1 Tax=Polaribacter huanghezhanensis TaxID=1354726 RepID=UPI0026477C0F|nr:ABC transporter ATP-binding protein [Polaribacter huanghezhanensis]WKD86858.1 Fe(3+) dicitrate transport ATP-binding protein FecE [Polaribacter huanghezhanensis]